MRVFLDANVLFSAAYRETGSVRAFFALARGDACTVTSSAYAVDEARRNIRAKHPDRMPDLELLVSELALCGEPSPATLAWVAANHLPPKDAPILAAAIDASCHLLATGDRTHFGTLFGKRVRGTVVALPVEAIEILIDEA